MSSSLCNICFNGLLLYEYLLTSVGYEDTVSRIEHAAALEVEVLNTSLVSCYHTIDACNLTEVEVEHIAAATSRNIFSSNVCLVGRYYSKAKKAASLAEFLANTYVSFAAKPARLAVAGIRMLPSTVLSVASTVRLAVVAPASL